MVNGKTPDSGEEKLSLKDTVRTIIRGYKDYGRIYKEVIREQKAKEKQRVKLERSMKLEENKELSLDEMLNLAESVESWENVPNSYYRTEYLGKTKGFEIRVGQRPATPWFGWFKYINVEYGNLVLGEFPEGAETDWRLKDFYERIPIKIRQQGLEVVRKK